MDETQVKFSLDSLNKNLTQLNSTLKKFNVFLKLLKNTKKKW